MRTNHFIFDENKCVGCEACVVACINENGFQEPERWRNVHASNPQKFPGIALFYMSMSCNHCEIAVCMDNCPALAYSRSITTGAVLHNADKCIGCKYCTWNCPYDAPKYNPFSGVINKCNLCEARLSENQKPACASLCPTGALDFSFEANNTQSDTLDLNVPVNTRPSIIIKKPFKESAPKIDHSLFEKQEMQPQKNGKQKITIAKEWTLIIFTLIVSMISAIASSGIMNNASLASKISLPVAGAFAAFLSTAHLGKPLRAWRALFNIHKSWLSREIFFFSLFYLILIVDFLITDVPNSLTIIFSLFLLLSIDMLYKPAQVYWKTRLHSAQTLFIAASFYLLLTEVYWFFAAIMIIRLHLFIKQSLIKGNFKKLRIVRITIILASGWYIFYQHDNILLIYLYIVGEIIDRLLFYEELQVADISTIIN
jgi:Fe-S-cluster-containing dehydrogenase component/DMSO reductase anchor subunit